MQFSDISTNQGIIQDITFLTGANLASDYVINERTRNINLAYSKIASLIIQADGRWQWDDANHTNQPTAVFDLVADQEDYSVIVPAPTALQDWLLIEQVSILDNDDNGILLTSIDKKDPKQAWSEFEDVAGTPKYFDMLGASIFLKPKPDYNKTEGGIITFQRHPSYFAVDDTTKRPGFARMFHRYLSLSASYDWLLKTGSNKINIIKNDMLIMEQEIKKFYSSRNKYEVPKLSRAYKSFK